MPITAVSSDGVEHEFPDGTGQAVIGKAMKAYAVQHTAKPTSPPEKRADPGLMIKLSDAITAPFKSTAKAIGDEAGKASAAYRADVQSAGAKAAQGKALTPGETAAPVIDALNFATSPVMGPLHAALGEKGGDLASFAIPVAGELAEGRMLAKGAQEAGVGVNTLRKTLAASKAPEADSIAAKDAESAVAGKLTQNSRKALTTKAVANPDRQALVSKLQSEGVQLTRGQALGGREKALQEALKSNPMTREGVIDAERQSFQSMNRGAYNRALTPLGLKYDPKGPVGYEGIKRVGDTLSKAYDQISPRLKLEQDDHLAMDLDDIKQDVGELPKAQQEQYETIMKNRFFAPLVKHGGVMNGQDFKDMESSISQAAATWKGSPDPAHRELGKALDASLGALRDNLERSSDPSVRDQLKAVNTGWANFVRLQGAAANRVKSGGVFTPGDLLTATKRADRSVRKGAFARGDALMQDYGNAAQQVMGDEIPDSGTAFRLAQLMRTGGAAGIGGMVGHIPGALAGMAAEPATNAVAKAFTQNTTADLGKALLQRGSPLTGRNYLSQITRQSSALNPPRPMLALPAAAIASQASSQ